MLLGREQPATATGLYEELRAAGDRTGLSTVYRGLHALLEAGLVHEFRTFDQSAYLVCPAEPHQHLICRSCARVQHQPIDDAPYRRATADAFGFVVTEHRVESYGMCRRCRH
jgi:Fur family ferric uptake transcriptional regulator